MGTLIAIVLSAVLTDNFITSQTLGICPFLGVSKKTSSALGMGVAVSIVMALATLVTLRPLRIPHGAAGHRVPRDHRLHLRHRLARADARNDHQEGSPLLLYNAMGIYLPLITTNCAVLGVTEMVIGDMSSVMGEAAMNLGWAVPLCLPRGHRLYARHAHHERASRKAQPLPRGQGAFGLPHLDGDC